MIEPAATDPARTFIDTCDPHALTVEDCARWCEALAEHIRANPDGTDWMVRVGKLQKRLAAVEYLIRVADAEQAVAQRTG